MDYNNLDLKVYKLYGNDIFNKLDITPEMLKFKDKMVEILKKTRQGKRFLNKIFSYSIKSARYYDYSYEHLVYEAKEYAKYLIRNPSKMLEFYIKLQIMFYTAINYGFLSWYIGRENSREKDGKMANKLPFGKSEAYETAFIAFLFGIIIPRAKIGHTTWRIFNENLINGEDFISFEDFKAIVYEIALTPYNEILKMILRWKQFITIRRDNPVVQALLCRILYNYYLVT